MSFSFYFILNILPHHLASTLLGIVYECSTQYNHFPVNKNEYDQF